MPIVMGLCDDTDSRISVGCPIVHPAGGQMLFISAGSFEMGCGEGQSSSYCRNDELPVHSVTLTNNFWIGTTEVTQEEFSIIMGYNPTPTISLWVNDDTAVLYLSWSEAASYANALSLLEGLESCYRCRRHRLGSELYGYDEPIQL
jgi:formylglycine-generating enzyme required for sulfatase activity